MVTVKQTIPVYEYSYGLTTTIDEVVGVESAHDEQRVVLVFPGGNRFIVRADDLRTAIDNATNTGK